jgi:hypothetical protein
MKGWCKMRSKTRTEESSDSKQTVRFTYRSWWVDVPAVTLLILYHCHFYSHGTHPVPPEMPSVCWLIVGMYLLVKEQVRKIIREMERKHGIIFVALWLGSLLEFFVVMAAFPGAYKLPPKMIDSTLTAIAGFIWILPKRQTYLKKAEKLLQKLKLKHA